MKVKSFITLIVVAVFLTGVLKGGYTLLSSQLKPGSPAKTIADISFGWKFPVAKFPTTGSGGQLAYSSIRDPGGIPQGLPVRLKIPVLGVDSAIEDALITPDGRMDVPAGSVNVAWFSLGPHPGQVGSAVIGGHFGIQNGVPFVFYNLDKVKAGDKLYIVDDKGQTLAFSVKSMKSFDRNADATTVFTSSDGIAHLNLITCEGVWNQVNGTYPQRLVVFADAISGEGAITVKPKPALAPAAVTVKPKPALAPAKVTAQATSTPSPKPAFLASPAAALTNTLADLNIPQSFPSLGQIIIQNTKSLYATALDGIITSVLLLSIFFVAFKIIRR